MKPDIELAPNVITLKREDNFLILNTEVGSWEIVDKELIDYISNKSQRNLNVDILRKLYLKKLLSINKKINNIKIPDLENSSLLVVFEMTEKCNLRCEYCYKDAGIGVNANSLKIKNLIDQILRLPYDQFFFNFHGGEPLLVFDLIKDVVSHSKTANNSNKTVRYHLTTNGTLIN